MKHYISSEDNVSFTAVVDRIEEKMAVLKSSRGQTLDWPVSLLPPGAAEGGILQFFISRDLKEQASKEELAKAMLNELLQRP